MTADLDTTSSFVVAVAEMELAKRAGIAADQVNLGVSGNSNSGDVLDLSKIWGADDYPIDMIRSRISEYNDSDDPLAQSPKIISIRCLRLSRT